jgi:hypothetical protein
MFHRFLDRIESLSSLNQILHAFDCGMRHVADRERDTVMLKREPKATGRPATGKGTKLVPFSKGGMDRQAAQLAKRRRAGSTEAARQLIGNLSSGFASTPRKLSSSP